LKGARPQITILVANLPAERDRRVIRECLSLEAHGYDVTVIATNESYRENALRRGVPPEKVVVVRNGPSSDEVARVPGSSEPDGQHTIVYLGVLGPQDNVQGAVLAAEELVRRRGRTDWRMVVAGDGECMPALRELVTERHLDDVVRFTGWLDGAAVDDLLRDATVAIQPDLPTRMNHLSTMAKSVEYVARGLPLVAADLLETRRTAAGAAVYVPTGSPEEFAAELDSLLDDPDRRARMRDEGLRRFAEILAWEHQAGQYIGLWDRLLARRRGRVPRPARYVSDVDVAREPDPAGKR
jgi:glycosyltransferase involved in cell wall biosynthesis